MTCFLPARSTNLQVNSSTEAETTCNLDGRDQRAILSFTLQSYLSCVFGKQDSRALISCFNTFKQAMIYQVCKRGFFLFFFGLSKPILLFERISYELLRTKSAFMKQNLLLQLLQLRSYIY